MVVMTTKYSTIQKEVEQKILEQYSNLEEFAKEQKLDYSEINAMFHDGGIKDADVSTVIEVCSAIGIDVNELAKRIK